MKRIFLIFIIVLGIAAGLSAEDLRFVVIGDTQPTFLKEEYPIFEREIGQINALRPDLVINMGDVIRGYGLSRMETEWERYDRIAARVHAPYYTIPGNHDIYNRASEKIYHKRYGKGYRSVDCKGCRFILLNNMERGEWGRMEPEQIEWLKKELAGSQGRKVYVFVHVPVWYPNANHVNKKWRELWMTRIHPLLRKYNVEAVFAGHFHKFGPTLHADGITYYISGGGGGRLSKLYASKGGGHHFLFAELRQGRLSVDVITASSVLNTDKADVVKSAGILEPLTSRAIRDFESIALKPLRTSAAGSPLAGFLGRLRLMAYGIEGSAVERTKAPSMVWDMILSDTVGILFPGIVDFFKDAFSIP